MINFIIYEKDKNLNSEIKGVIYKFFASNNDEFKIYNYENKNKIEGCKIYILSSNNFDELIKIAKDIRNSGDYDNPIILISNVKKIKLDNYLLILSIINNDKDKNLKLSKSISKAYDILINSQTFNFYFNRMLYRIPLKDILYIEKENNSNTSLIHTKSIIYETNESIINIEKRINCIKFMKVHRSCIVNLDNIIKYDYPNNTLYFENDSIDIIARDKRNILKDKLTDEK